MNYTLTVVTTMLAIKDAYCTRNAPESPVDRKPHPTAMALPITQRGCRALFNSCDRVAKPRQCPAGRPVSRRPAVYRKLDATAITLSSITHTTPAESE